VEPTDDSKALTIPTPSVSVSMPAPAAIAKAGPQAEKRFFEFFTANIRNKNTREAYFRALNDFFRWCDDHECQLIDIEPIVVAAYVEYLTSIYSPPTVKQHLAAIRMCFDWLVVGQILPSNPVSAVRGPKHVVKRGKTPVLTPSETRKLLDGIDTSTTVGLRDRAIIGLMVYSFSRVGAVVRMRESDFYAVGKRWWFRLHEKGGRFHEVPAHHKAQEYVDDYLQAAGSIDKSAPLFRTAKGRSGDLTSNGMTRHDVLRMVKRRALAAGLSDRVCCHTFRATGITAYLLNGGTIEHAQAIAAHESPRTTKLYDRTDSEIALEEVERIRL